MRLLFLLFPVSLALIFLHVNDVNLCMAIRAIIAQVTSSPGNKVPTWLAPIRTRWEIHCSTSCLLGAFLKALIYVAIVES